MVDAQGAARDGDKYAAVSDAAHAVPDALASPRRDSDHEKNLVTAVWLDWHALQACAERGEGDVLHNREAVLGAVKASGGEAFQFAGAGLKKDRDMVLDVMQTNGLAMQWADPELKCDRNFILEAVKLDGRALKYAAPNLQADREVVLTAVRQHGPALAYATDDLLADFSLLLEATQSEMECNAVGVQDKSRSLEKALQQTREMALKEEFRSVTPLAVSKVGKPEPEGAGPSDYDELLQSFRGIKAELKDMKEEIDKKEEKFAYLNWR